MNALLLVVALFSSTCYVAAHMVVVVLSRSFDDHTEELPILTTLCMDYSVFFAVGFSGLTVFIFISTLTGQRKKHYERLIYVNAVLSIVSLLIAILVMYLPLFAIFEV